MEGISELNKYFETIEEKKDNDPNEIIAELQQAMTAMSRAIEQIALSQTKTEDKMEEVEEVKEDTTEEKTETEDTVEEKEL